MDITNIPDRIWKEVLYDTMKIEFESLSFKILISNLRMKIKLHPEKETLFINKIKKMIVAQDSLPSLQHDILKIKEKGGIA